MKCKTENGKETTNGTNEYEVKKMIVSLTYLAEEIFSGRATFMSQGKETTNGTNEYEVKK